MRKALRLSQTAFGKSLGTTRDIISNIERSRSEPKKAFLDLMCRLFNVNPEWLFNGEGEMFNPLPPLNDELEEAARLFTDLSPALQKYALQQIKGLLEVQNLQGE